MTGPKYGVYERWFTECNPPRGITHTAGLILISLAVWFMMGSSYAEFAFSRAIQYRHGGLYNIEEIPSEAVNQEREEDTESKPSDSEEMNNSWYARHRNHILVGTFKCLIGLFIGAIATRMIIKESRSPTWERNNGPVLFLTSGLLKCLTIITLVFLHMIGTNRLSQFFRCRFHVGIIFGIGGGPFYLILPLKKKIRESKNWSDVSDGAHVGMTLLETYLALFFVGFFRFI